MNHVLQKEKEKKCKIDFLCVFAFMLVFIEENRTNCDSIFMTYWVSLLFSCFIASSLRKFESTKILALY